MQRINRFGFVVMMLVWGAPCLAGGIFEAQIILNESSIIKGGAVSGRVVLENVSRSEIEIVSPLSPGNKGISFELVDGFGNKKDIQSGIHVRRANQPSFKVLPGAKVAIPFFLLKASGHFVTGIVGELSIKGKASLKIIVNQEKIVESLETNLVSFEVLPEKPGFQEFISKFENVYECLAPFSMYILPKDISFLEENMEEYDNEMKKIFAFQLGGWKMRHFLSDNSSLEKSSDDMKLIFEEWVSIASSVPGSQNFKLDIVAGAILTGENHQQISSELSLIMDQRGMLYFEK